MNRTFAEMLEAAHIKLPVTADGSSVETGDCRTPNGNYDLITTTQTAWGTGMSERNKARAELIALALNNHGALVATVEDLVSTFSEVCGTHIYSDDDAHPHDCLFCESIKFAQGVLASLKK